MQMKFRVVKRKTHLPNKNGKKEFYTATKVKNGVATEGQIAELISQKTTFNAGEVEAIIDVVADQMIHYLEMGHSVKLGRLGTFTLDLTSDTVEERKDFTHRNVKGAKVRFTPSVSLKSRLNKLTFGDIDSVQ